MDTQFSQRLASGERVYGTAIVSPSPLWPKVVKSCGLDFVFLDTEHIPLGRETLASMCQAYRALEIAPIVRIPNPDPYEASKAMDAGAVGIVAPYLESPEQIRDLVGATKYRPLKGKRLQEILNSEIGPGRELSDYLEKYNAGNVCIANIESLPALDRLDDMLAVAGLDGVFIGPHDLSCSLGLPEQYNHPQFKEALSEIIRKSREHHLAVGVHFPNWPEYQVEYVRAGANIVIHSADITLFARQLKQDLDDIRKNIGDNEKAGDDMQTPVI